MKREPERFGFFAPPPPAPRSMPAIDSPLLLGDFIATDSEQTDKPADPVGQFTAKAQDDAACGKNAATADYAKLVGLLFRPADIRSSAAPLHKAVSVGSLPDWSWDAPASTDTPLEKRATGTAKERFEKQLQEFFRGHNDEYWEARGICDQLLDDERAAVMANEA
jgi:hypothetical protein